MVADEIRPIIFVIFGRASPAPTVYGWRNPPPFPCGQVGTSQCLLGCELTPLTVPSKSGQNHFGASDGCWGKLSPSPQSRVKTWEIKLLCRVPCAVAVPSKSGQNAALPLRNALLRNRRPLKVGSKREYHSGGLKNLCSRRPLKVGSKLRKRILLALRHLCRRPLKVGSKLDKRK